MSMVSSDQALVLPTIDPNNPPLSVKILGTAVATGIGIVAQYGLVSVIHWPIEKLGWCSPEYRTNHSALAALTVPLRPLSSWYFSELLGCTHDTPWRNMTCEMASTLSSTCISAFACNYFGYNIDMKTVAHNQLLGIGLQLMTLGMVKGVQYLDELIDENDVEDFENPPSIDPKS